MCQKEDIRLKLSGVPPTIERNSGAINATDKLLIIEYAAVTEILPQVNQQQQELMLPLLLIHKSSLLAPEFH